MLSKVWEPSDIGFGGGFFVILMDFQKRYKKINEVYTWNCSSYTKMKWSIPSILCLQWEMQNLTKLLICKVVPPTTSHHPWYSAALLSTCRGEEVLHFSFLQLSCPSLPGTTFLEGFWIMWFAFFKTAPQKLFTEMPVQISQITYEISMYDYYLIHCSPLY